MGNFKLEIEALADFVEEEEMGCRWVKFRQIFLVWHL